MKGWHELWAHRTTGEFLAIHLVNGFVAGICGPLSVSAAKAVDLTALDSDASMPAIYLASTQPEEFVLAEPWLRGERVPVRRPRGLLTWDAIKSRRSRPARAQGWRAPARSARAC
jgi:hypothetical protein